MMTPLSENDLLAQMNTDLNVPQPYAGELLAEAYRILHIMWPAICKAQEEGRIYAFLQQNEPGAEFILDDYIINVTYGDGGMRGFMGQSGHRKEDAPIGGGFIIRQDANRFLVCGLSCNVQVNPNYAEQAQVFVLDKREMHCTKDGLVPGRILNGDERNYMALGAYPCLQELAFYRK